MWRSCFALSSSSSLWRGSRRLLSRQPQRTNSSTTRRCTRPPTACALVASSRRSGFRRRVSLVVGLLRLLDGHAAKMIQSKSEMLKLCALTVLKGVRSNSTVLITSNIREIQKNVSSSLASLRTVFLLFKSTPEFGRTFVSAPLYGQAVNLRRCCFCSLLYAAASIGSSVFVFSLPDSHHSTISKRTNIKRPQFFVSKWFSALAKETQIIRF